MRYRRILPLCGALVLGLIVYQSENRDRRQIAQAELAVANGQIDEAIELYRDLTLRPRGSRHEAQALYQVASLSYLRHRDTREAVTKLRALLRDYPETNQAVRGRFLLAQIYEQDWKRQTKALEIYRGLLAAPLSARDRAAAYLASGRLHALLGQRVHAKHAYLRALTDGTPESRSEAYNALVRIHLADGAPDEAFALAVRQLEATDERLERRVLYLNRIELFQQIGHEREAHRLRARGQEEFPRDEEFSVIVGRTTTETDDTEHWLAGETGRHPATDRARAKARDLADDAP